MKCSSAVVLALTLLVCSESAPRIAVADSLEMPGLNYGHVDKLLSLPCPDGMVEIQGDYCPVVSEVCLRYVDAHGNPTDPPPKGMTGRCGEYAFPTTCQSVKVAKHFCIDKYEYPNVEGERPKSWMDWYDAKRACESEGKRLCGREEWTFACEGPDMHPYPYGDGYHRNREACNTDNLPHEDPNRPLDSRTGKHPNINVFDATSHATPTAKILDDMLAPSGSKKDCVSPFGVYDQVGNVDELVVNPTGQPYHSGLMGGHIWGVRNACRPMTEAHNEGFAWYETGARCCKDW